MSADNQRRPNRPRRLRSQAGAFAVEFALVFICYMTFVFCVIEVARVVYIWNTLQEVTRRAANAAANTDFTSASATSAVRQDAVFRNSSGYLSAASPITDAHVRIDYMSLARAADGTMTLTPMAAGAMATSPARNKLACMSDQNGAGCIRFVRARICVPSADPTVCDSVQYVPLLPLITVSVLKMPRSTTIARAETLGYQSGQALGP